MSVLVPSERGWTVSYIEQPAAKELARSAEYIALRVPGHKWWRKVGERGYAPAETQVWRIIEARESGRLIAERVLSWSVAKAEGVSRDAS